MAHIMQRLLRAGLSSVVFLQPSPTAACPRSSQFFGPSVYRGPGHRRSIALTFDDGPSEGTLPLLEYLAKEQVTCTFFQCTGQ